MRIIANTLALAYAAKAAALALPTRTPRDILKCLRLEATRSPNALTVTGTNGEVEVRASALEVDTMEPGVAVVPAERLLLILASCSALTVNLETDDKSPETFWIRTDDAAFKLFGYPTADYPPPGRALPTDSPAITMPAPAFSAAMKRARISESRKDDSRYSMASVLIKSKGEELEVVATDGISMTRTKHLGGNGRPGQVLLPKPAVDALHGIAGGAAAEELVTLTWDATRAVARVRGKDGPGEKLGQVRVEVGTTLSEGVFPPYEDIVPKMDDGLPVRVVVQAEALLAALRKAMIFRTVDTASVTFRIADDFSLVLQGGNHKGYSNVPVPKAELHGTLEQALCPGTEIHLRGDYLAEALATCDDLQVTMGMGASKAAALLICEGFELVLAKVNIPPQAERAVQEKD